ncbi:hypothetical protein ACFX1T_034376 [Malus domestica]
MVLALVTTKKKLRQYFEAHTIVVLTNQPMRVILSKPDLSGRITKWAIELSSFDIKYQSRSAAKGQVIADFLIECYPRENLLGECEEIAKADPNEIKWELYVDGSSNQAGAGAGIILISPEGIDLECSVRLDFPASNNVAEHEALVLGLELAKQLKISRLTVHSDSQLIVGQATEEYMTKNAKIEAYRQLVKGLVNGFKYFELKQIPREMSKRADQLACATSTAQRNLRVVEVEYMHSPSIGAVQSDVMQIGGQRLGFDNPLPEQAQAEDNDYWMTPIVNYLTKGIQPEDLVAVRYAILSDTLYRRSFSGPYLRCLNPR